MSLTTDEWKLTAYALGELDREEADVVSRQVTEDTALARTAAEIRRQGEELAASLARVPARRLDAGRRARILLPPPRRRPPQHYKIGRWVFTPLSIAELVATIVLGIAGIGMAVSAYRDFQLKHHLDRALACHASGQMGNATEHLGAAMAARTVEEWPYPYLLQAKIDVNEGRLDEAQALYERLKGVQVGQQGWTQGHQAGVHVGLGCIALRRFDKTMDTTLCNPKLLAIARAAFLEAQGTDEKCLEAGIGLAHVALREGWDPSRQRVSPAACDLAQKELARIDAALLTPTVDGLVDKYMAQGRIAYERGDFSRAETEFRRAFELQPSWKGPFANVAFMMARFFIVSGPARMEDIAERQLELDEFVQRLESLYHADTERYAVFKEAMFSLFNSLGVAFCRAYRQEHGFNYLSRAADIDSVRPTVAINRADIYQFYSESAKFSEQEQLQFANNARAEWLRAADQCRATNQPLKRMICLYNRAVILYNKDPKDITFVENAWSDLKDVAREFPGSPPILWAQAAIERRLGKITEAHQFLGEARRALETWRMTPEERDEMRAEFDRFEEGLKKGTIEDESPK